MPMAGRSIHRVLTLLAAVAASLAGTPDARGDQQATAQAIVDADYGFRLDSPGPGWRLMGEREVSTLAPDALAGAMAKGVWGIVIVEAWGGKDVAEFARLVTENTLVEGRRTLSTEEIAYAGGKALRTNYVGTMQGMDLQWSHVALLHGGYAYQVVAWVLRGSIASPETVFRPFHDAFHLLPGPVRGRSTKPPAPDATGPGWTLRSGVFSSATYRFAVTPPAGWRVLVGSELRRMNAEAEVGLERTNPEGYVVVIPERAASVDRSAFAAQIRASFAEGKQRRPGKEAPARLGGVELALAPYGIPDRPGFAFHHGVVFRDDLCFQVLAWTSDAADAKTPAWWGEALAALRFLDADAIAVLERDIAASLSPARTFGQGHSVRGDVVRDFEGGFTWRRPSSAWRVSVGAEARERNAEASVYLENPSRGLYGVVIAERADDGAAYHAAVVRGLIEGVGGAPQPTAVRLGDLPAWTTALAKTEPMALAYRVTTAVRAGRAVQLVLWGPSGNVTTSESELRAAADGLRLPVGGLGAPGRLDGTAWRDERAGFELRAP